MKAGGGRGWSALTAELLVTLKSNLLPRHSVGRWLHLRKWPVKSVDCKCSWACVWTETCDLLENIGLLSGQIKLFTQ